MRKAILILAGLLSACASAPKVRGSSESPELQSDRAVAAQLRAISTRVKRGEAAKVREELLEQQKAKPDDTKLAIYLAWTRAPEDDAWQDISNLGKLNPNEPWAALCSGAIYLQWQKNFLEQADTEFAKVLRDHPTSVAAKTGHADVLRLKGEREQAKKAYEAVLAEVGDWHEALAGYALTLDAMKDPGARAALEKAFANDKNDVEVLAALARVSAEAKDADAALGYLRELVQYDWCEPMPTPTPACVARNRDQRLSLAQMEKAKGNLAAAAEQWEKVLTVAPDVAIARELAVTYRALGESELESRVLETIAKLDTGDTAALVRLAEIAQATGDVDAAAEALKQAAERPTAGAPVLLARARVERERGDLVAAIEAYRAAVEKGAGADAAADLKELEARASVNQRPAKGDPNAVYSEVSARLRDKVQALRKAGKAVAGQLNVRVTIGTDGKATQVEFIEDSVKDGLLRALVYFSLKDAKYPKAARTPVFEFAVKAK